MSPRALVIEDDADLRFLLARLLRDAGLEVEEACDGAAGLRAFYSWRPDVVLLDVGLPELDGFEVLGRIRELSAVPVLMLTAQASELEKVRGLQGGADDYVTKPFGRQELLARVQVCLRRNRREETGELAAAPVHRDALLTVDFREHAVHVGEEPVALSPQEFRLLAALVRHPGQLLTHEQLLELAWGDAEAGRERLKVYVGYLRRKLAAAGAEPIETVRGLGYRYRPAPAR